MHSYTMDVKTSTYYFNARKKKKNTKCDDYQASSAVIRRYKMFLLI